MGGNVRAAVNEGRGDAIPIFLSEIPLLFQKKIIQPDVAIVHVRMYIRYQFNTFLKIPT